ncbi:MAG TPA: AI-2E family transporter [Streptosporangiaceae bacterium]|nr:AI-2E family transporter [Streptosporangiaceae bacterium]
MLVADRTEEVVAPAQRTDAGANGRPFGEAGRQFDRRSPFFIGMTAAAGVAVTYGLIQLTLAASSVLVLTGLALFLAIGLDPAVSWLTRHRVPRWAAVTLIALAALGLVGGFLALAIPPLAQQGTQLVDHLPGYLSSLQNHNSLVGKLNDQFHLQQRINHLSSGSGLGFSMLGGVLGAGQVVLNAVSSTLIVLVLTIYFLHEMPRIKSTFYRCIPQSRRERVILIGDDVLSKVGAFVMGNLLTSLIAGLGTLIWLEVVGVPYAVLLGLFAAIMDLIPIIGSTVGGVIVSLIALTVSLPIAIATAVFYIVYRVAEDYFLVPRIMGKAVEVPGVVTVLAVLVGGTLLGMIGALVAIPIAAALRLVLREVAFPRLENS